MACHELIGPAVDRFFAASTFGKLPKDQYGSVALLPLFDYIMRGNAMTQTVSSSQRSTKSMRPLTSVNVLHRVLKFLPGEAAKD